MTEQEKKTDNLTQDNRKLKAAKIKSLETMLGILAYDIHMHSDDNLYRLFSMYEICYMLRRANYSKQLRDEKDNTYDNGKWFCTSWEGPYYSDTELINVLDEELKKYFKYLRASRYKSIEEVQKARQNI